MIVGVVAAHPDDEVLGCGGTTARLARAGHPVKTLILGGGGAARDGDQTGVIRQLMASADRAAQELGTRTLTVAPGKLADNRFDDTSLLTTVKLIEAWLAKARPTLVFTHFPGCLNVDHRITAQAVLTATRPGTSSVTAVCAFEVPSATEWAFGALGHFQPTLFYDISETLEHKLQAMRAYADEMRPFPHPRSDGALRALAACRGTQAGVQAAEAFMVLRETR